MSSTDQFEASLRAHEKALWQIDMSTAIDTAYGEGSSGKVPQDYFDHAFTQDYSENQVLSHVTRFL